MYTLALWIFSRVSLYMSQESMYAMLNRDKLWHFWIVYRVSATLFTTPARIYVLLKCLKMNEIQVLHYIWTCVFLHLICKIEHLKKKKELLLF